MTNLIIPANVPWKDLKGKDLEECLYWLLDEMGAKDLEWRVGGTGDGTADGGRDLEAQFYMSTPDGELSKQRWWVEAKGRSRTVEPDAIKGSILNATGRSDVDVLVIATNTQFSNPTRDWVKQWQKERARPIIRLWDRHDLERLVSKNPAVAVRLFAEALSNQGKLEVLRSRFWNSFHFPGETDLRIVWKHRKELDWDASSLLAVIAGEMSNGDVSLRPWGTLLDNETTFALVAYGLLNTLYFCLRAERAGSKQEPYLAAMAYIILVSLDRLPADAVASMLDAVWELSSDTTYPAEIRELVLSPIRQRLTLELRDVCTSDCRRVSTDPMVLNEDSIRQYWNRLLEPEEKEESTKGLPVLIIEHHHTPCKVGFSLNQDAGCPLLVDDEVEPVSWEDLFNSLKRVIAFRKSEQKTQNLS